jgi:hypothetical protein
MALAQRARDAQMAARMVEVSGDAGVVLIAGAGHVRKDRGVAAAVHMRRQEAGIASLAFVEVDHQATDPQAYAAHFSAPRLPFDFVWFTPRYSDEDPCEKFKKKVAEPLVDRPVFSHLYRPFRLN